MSFLDSDEVKVVSALQLSNEELFFLRLLANVDVADAAKALGVKRQYVYKVREKAYTKLVRQGFVDLPDEEDDYGDEDE